RSQADSTSPLSIGLVCPAASNRQYAKVPFVSSDGADYSRCHRTSASRLCSSPGYATPSWRQAASRSPSRSATRSDRPWIGDEPGRILLRALGTADTFSGCTVGGARFMVFKGAGEEN